MKKKFLAAVVAATAALGLSACGGDEDPNKNDPIEEPSGDSSNNETPDTGNQGGTQGGSQDSGSQGGGSQDSGSQGGGSQDSGSQGSGSQGGGSQDGGSQGGATEQTTFTVTFNSKDGTSVSSATVNENDKVSKPTDPTKEGFVFGGWYTDEACTSVFDFNTEITGNITLYAKWTEEAYTPEGFDPAPEGYEYVNYNFLPATYGDTQDKTYAEDTTYGNFTILSGTTLRKRSKTYADASESKSFTHSVKLNGSAAGLKVVAPGAGKLVMYIQNGSGSAGDNQILNVNKNGADTTIEYPAASIGSAVYKLEIEVAANDTFIFRCGGTTDVYEANMICLVEKSEVVGFEIVNNGTLQYLEGQAYDSSKVSVNAVYGNGRREAVANSDLTFDTSLYQANVAGKYDVKVSYGEYAAQTIQVEVFEIESLRLGFNRMEKLSSNTKAGNGQYFNKTVKQTYLVGQDFDPTNIVITAVCIDGNSNEVIFDLSKSDIITYDLAQFNKNVAGTYEVTVKYQSTSKLVSDSFNVYVVNTEPAVTDNKVNLYVNPSYTGVVGAVEEINGVNSNVFTTIQSALEYLGAKNIAGDVEKVITLKTGTYNEKLEITLPYVTLQSETGDADDVLIEWDSLYGLTDESGYTHVTDSTQTVAVRDTAVGFKASGITFSNYWNSLERFDAKLGANYGEHRALALLVQADQVILEDCSLLGYQDTVEFFTGRQLLKDCYISGTTDFIFGTNNTTYFDNCTIHSITSGKTDGGYITAFKGCNKGAQDYVQYGAIFDGCTFTADSDVVEAGNTAIARPWGAYAAVAVINSDLGAHISKVGYTTGAGKNARYVEMSGCKPTETTVKFVEYNNTGAGAITEAVTGMRFLDATEAANYSNLAVVFGTTNGLVAYSSVWDPNAGIVRDPKTYYDFVTEDGAAVSPTGTVYQYDDSTIGSQTEAGTATLGNLTINGHAKANRGNSMYCANGTTLTFDVAAGSMVTVEVYPTYFNYTINGVTAGADIFSQYYAENTTVVITSTGNLYIKTITINPEAEAPEAATLDELAITGAKTTFNVGDEFSAGDIVVTAKYSDSSVDVLDASEYTLDSSAVDLTQPGEYTVTITFNGFEATYTVTVYEAGVDPSVIAEDLQITFGSSGNYKDYLNSKLFKSDDATIRDNGGNNCQVSAGTLSIKVKAGAVVTISSYSGYTNYQLWTDTGFESADQTGTSYAYTATEDCTVNLTTTNSNNYYYYIDVKYPVALETISEDTEILFQTGGNYTNQALTGAYWTCGEEKADTCKISGDVTIKVLEGAKVQIVGYTEYSGYSQYGIYVTDAYGNTETTIATGVIGEYTYVAAADCVVIIRSEISSNYINAINVTYSSATLESYEVTGYATTLYVGNEFSVGDMVVVGTYSDESTANLTYTVDSSQVDMNTAGTYTVTINVTGFDTPFTYEVTVEEDTDPTVYYYFDGSTSDSGTVYSFASGTQHQGSATGNGTFGDITIDATAGKLSGNGTNAQINKGTKLTFDVAANSLVSIKLYDAESCTLNGVASTAKEFSVYYAEATTVEYLQIKNSYIYHIIISQPETAPTAGTLDSLRVSGVNTEFRVGDEYAIGDIVVNAIYTDKLVYTLTSTDYTIDTTAVDMTAAGEYEVVVTYNGITASYTVVVEDGEPLFTDGTIYESTTFYFGNDGDWKEYVTQSTDIQISDQTGQTQVKVGSVSFKVIAGSTVSIDAYGGQYTSYNLFINDEQANTETLVDDTTFTVSEDAVIKLETVNANNYYKSVTVTCPIAIAETTAIQFGTEGNYKKYMTYSDGASYGDQSGQTQIKSGSLSFYVMAGATIAIDAYGGNYTSYNVIVNGVQLNTETLLDDYTFTTTENSIVVLEAVTTDNGNYYKSMTVTYPVELQTISEATTIIFATGGNYTDATLTGNNFTVAEEKTDTCNIQGDITIKVAAGATVAINAYGSNYSNYALYTTDGTTETLVENLTDDYTYTATAETILILRSTGSFYIKDVKITF